MDSMIEALKKKYGKDLQTGDQPPLRRIRTDIPTLDYLLGGGLPVGNLVQIYGPEDVGKTATSLTMIAAAQKQGYICGFIDAERKLNHKFAKSLGVDLNKLIVLKPAYGEQAFEFIRDSGESGVGLIVIDSIPLLTPKATVERIEADPTKMDMASVGNMYNRLKEFLIRVTNEKDMCIVALNQVRPRMDGYPGWNIPGGQALRHIWAVSLEFGKDSTVTKDRQNTYIYPEDTKAIKVTCKKNHTARRLNKFAYMDIGPTGIDKLSSLFDILVETKIIQRNGAWYVVNDQKLQGRNSVIEYIKNNNLYDELYNSIVELND